MSGSEQKIDLPPLPGLFTLPSCPQGCRPGLWLFRRYAAEIAREASVTILATGVSPWTSNQYDEPRRGDRMLQKLDEGGQQ
jgi:hypothetical protein